MRFRSILVAVALAIASLWLVPAKAQLRSPIAVADNADLIAVNSGHVERRLMRLRFDRAAGRITVEPFGDVASDIFAVGPKGAFVVVPGTNDDGHTLVLLDGQGRPLGAPVQNPLGAVTSLMASPKGDLVAAVNDRGWVAVFAVAGAGPARHLQQVAVFGASPRRQLAVAFRPDGGLATLTDDWLLVLRRPDGGIERTLDLAKTVPNLAPSGFDESGACSLLVSPSGDHFVIIAGGGPIFALIVDREGRLVKLQGMEEHIWLGGSGAAFFDGGDKLWVFGMERPRIIDLKRRTMSTSADLENSPLAMAPLADGRSIAAFDAEGGVALYDDTGKLALRRATFENRSFTRAEAGADNELFAVAERGGWVDLYTKAGKFVRRIQTGTIGSYGTVALAADGTLAAFGEGAVAVMAPSGTRRWLATHSHYGQQDFLVAIAAEGGRIATVGPSLELRSWAADGRADGLYALRAGDHAPGRIWSLAVTPRGDLIAAADEGGALWLAFPADKRVVRVPLPSPPRAVAALTDGSGFAVGLADGTLMRVGRDGAVIGEPLKAASQWRGVGRLVPAPDGRSLVVIEEDALSARHLAWDGAVLSGPLRPHGNGRIATAFFQGGEAVLIITHADADVAKDPLIQMHHFGDPGYRRMKNFDAPKP